MDAVLDDDQGQTAFPPMDEASFGVGSDYADGAEDRTVQGTGIRIAAPIELDASSQLLPVLPLEEQIKFARVRRPHQRINAATVPLWFIPPRNRPKAEQERARKEFEDVMTLADIFVPRQKTVSLRVNDADVTFTLIKREMTKYVSTEEGERHAAFFEQILARLLPLFRKLSEQSSERQRLLQQLQDAHSKKMYMRKIVYDKRRRVLQVQRAVDLLRREEQARQERAKHDTEISQFLNDLRTLSSSWLS